MRYANNRTTGQTIARGRLAIHPGERRVLQRLRMTRQDSAAAPASAGGTASATKSGKIAPAPLPPVDGNVTGSTAVGAALGVAVSAVDAVAVTVGVGVETAETVPVG